ncbi:MAG: hypothetical protein NZM25_09915 [Leptospiraceae bacterium]|nr:hypothetical protein [Leptospiraceae bacterium]MDW8307464.1 hypothetical protein [Leptospiraceae bacterium]
MKIKFPGILKSRRRERFHLMPGTIWEVLLGYVRQDTAVPRESKLVLSPYSINPQYEDLVLLSEMMEPLKLLTHDLLHKEVFALSHKILEAWKQLSLDEKDFLVSDFYLSFYTLLGVYEKELFCYVCGKKEFFPKAYIVESGFLCPSCKTNYTPTEDARFLATWMYQILMKKNILSHQEHQKGRHLMHSHFVKTHFG